MLTVTTTILKNHELVLPVVVIMTCEQLSVVLKFPIWHVLKCGNTTTVKPALAMTRLSKKLALAVEIRWSFQRIMKQMYPA